jgi:hypothetical protein
MDHIDKVLATNSNSPTQYSPPIRAALAVGKNTLNKYYNKTDDSEVYRIAMGNVLLVDMLIYTNFCALSVLHPRHKLEYFKKHDWEEAWIDAAHDIVRKEFDRSYAPMGVEGSGGGMQADSNEAVGRRIRFYFFFFS